MSHPECKFEPTITVNELEKPGSFRHPSYWSIFRRLLSVKNPNPPPPKASIHDAVLTPETSAGFFNRLWFMWLTPLLSLGYDRPLEAPDLYKLPDKLSSAQIADAILTSFERRRVEAAMYNEQLANGEVSPGIRSLWWAIRGIRAEREKAWREKDGKRKASLILAINDSVKWYFWSAGIIKVVGDTAQVMSPMVIKAIIIFVKDSYDAHHSGKITPPIATGVGLCFAFFGLQLISSSCNQHFFYRGSASGVLVRGGLIAAVYSRALELSPRAHAQMSNGRLVNHISTDVSRIDFCMPYFHMAWTIPVQLSICLVLLLINLGPSALAGFAFLLIATLTGGLASKNLLSTRIKSMVWTDKRSKLLQEMLSGMRVIKFFSWEVPFLKRIAEYRKHETSYIRTLSMVRASLYALSFSLPTLGILIAIITYSLTGHPLTAANVFSSFSLFQIIRLPLQFFPTAFGSIADAVSACNRLYDVFEAETLDRTLVIDDGLDVAVRVDGADFIWDTLPLKPKDTNEVCNRGGMHHGLEGSLESVALPDRDADVFKLEGVNIEIPRGKLVAIVGAVGAGKSSLLQGIVGEMRRTSGTVECGGSIAYCAQTAWIQNATIRENICFGQPFDEERYWQAVRDCCLEPDLEILPSYDLTEVGERGISLSGGQKQRINVCRAIYRNSDIMIFDDPLSALDSHVGKGVFTNAFKKGTAGKTRILVTHALHFLPDVDYIYTLVDGKIAERGTFDALMANNGAFRKFMDDFGSQQANGNKHIEEPIAVVRNDEKGRLNGTKLKKAIMQEEERNVGAIPFKVYRGYLSFGKSTFLTSILFLSLLVLQGPYILSSYWLVYWGERKWNYSQDFYISIYAALGFSHTLTMFFIGMSFSVLAHYASQALHERAFARVLHAPIRFFETTPLGRIMNRFAKDIDTIDNMICDSLRMLSVSFSNSVGIIVFISIILPWFSLVSFFVAICCFYATLFYRGSARELKRLDAIMRSSLYAHFSESLTGLTTIFAYGEMDRFKKENIDLIDIENRAYWLTVANQRWLGIRLDLLGMILTFFAAILTIIARFSISPGQTGVILAFSLALQQSISWMIRLFSMVDNDMNSVERVLHYANEIEQEAPRQTKDPLVPSSWPSEGRIVMKDVFMQYRPELPPVLKGLSMDIAPSEKIGIVGRTGAGKSSIVTALYRLVELSSGSIQIDGVDISKVGLEQLRKGLAIIPQDTFLFSGTLRLNLDPFGLYDDARLWDALKRSHLVDADEKQLSSSQSTIQCDSYVSASRFDLDTPIDSEGSNLSVGQRSLVSLARALVHETKILVLDEATASVDYETDEKVQQTIATEFKERTILCIAHRLRTILSYDRICVVDAGVIAEFDTPANLFNTPDSIFRGMCDKSNISLEDILSASK